MTFPCLGADIYSYLLYKHDHLKKNKSFFDIVSPSRYYPILLLFLPQNRWFIVFTSLPPNYCNLLYTASYFHQFFWNRSCYSTNELLHVKPVDTSRFIFLDLTVILNLLTTSSCIFLCVPVSPFWPFLFCFFTGSSSFPCTLIFLLPRALLHRFLILHILSGGLIYFRNFLYYSLAGDF